MISSSKSSETFVYLHIYHFANCSRSAGWQASGDFRCLAILLESRSSPHSSTQGGRAKSLLFSNIDNSLRMTTFEREKKQNLFFKSDNFVFPKVNTLPGPGWPGRACRNLCCGNYYHRNDNHYHYFLEEKQNSVITH